jgi:hypothetical protein
MLFESHGELAWAQDLGMQSLAFIPAAGDDSDGFVQADADSLHWLGHDGRETASWAPEADTDRLVSIVAAGADGVVRSVWRTWSGERTWVIDSTPAGVTTEIADFTGPLQPTLLAGDSLVSVVKVDEDFELRPGWEAVTPAVGSVLIYRRGL